MIDDCKGISLMARTLLVLPLLLLSACQNDKEVTVTTQDGQLLSDSFEAGSIIISNARMIDGSGTDIDLGYMLITDGVIVEISNTPLAEAGAYQIDATGKTLMPGFIDAHRHIIQGEPAAWLADEAESSMHGFLEAGFTTVFSAGDAEKEILELRRRTASDEIAGPTIIAAARAPTAVSRGNGNGDDPARTDVSRPPHRPTEAAEAVPVEATISRVQQIADGGFDAVKTVIIATPGGPEIRTLGMIAQESAKYDIPTVTHAVTVVDTLAAVDAGRVTTLVHTPHIGQLTPEEAQKIVSSGATMVSTLGIFVPFFDGENAPIFRDEDAYPWDTISSAGQGPVNARLLWEAGMVYGFGTDTRYDPSVTLKHELKSLHLVFSEKDIVRIMTVNAASNLGLQDSIGALRPGMTADLVLLNGDPLVDLYDLLKIEVVMKKGRIVIDNRSN
jgi:imidazolonepropionase-like amidohydrolase